MSPTRIMIIRHAEAHDVPGITCDSHADSQNLIVRGWQRAGALVPFFCSGAQGLTTPNTIFASGIAPGRESRRPADHRTTARDPAGEMPDQLQRSLRQARYGRPDVRGDDAFRCRADRLEPLPHS